MRHTVYTIWASMKGEEPSPWMLHAEDEYSWEGDPDRCEKAFQDARNLADKNDWDYREVEIKVDYAKIAACFENGVVEGEVAA